MSVVRLALMGEVAEYLGVIRVFLRFNWCQWSRYHAGGNDHMPQCASAEQNCPERIFIPNLKAAPNM